MALTRALAATGEVIEDSEVTVTSALSTTVKAWLPAIDDGGTTTVAAGFQTLVMANGSGDVEIVDVFGRRVHTVLAGSAVVFKATGDLARPVWVPFHMPNQLQIGLAVAAAGATTPALGTTCPAASGTVKWIGATLVDGTAGYIPCWT